MEIKILPLQTHGDERGSLVALEEWLNIPFEIKRVYYLYDTKKGFEIKRVYYLYDTKKGIARGFHAHKNLTQVVVAVRGSCRFVLDNGQEKTSVQLDNPTQGLLIESGIWREMYDFSEDCVLMVLASQLYDESDYIRDYEEFLKNSNKEML